jgi:hypothetical protein
VIDVRLGNRVRFNGASNRDHSTDATHPTDDPPRVDLAPPARWRFG